MVPIKLSKDLNHNYYSSHSSSSPEEKLEHYDMFQCFDLLKSPQTRLIVMRQEVRSGGSYTIT